MPAQARRTNPQPHAPKRYPARHAGEWGLEGRGFIDDMPLPRLDAKEIQADDLARAALLPQAIGDAGHGHTQSNNMMHAIRWAHE